VGRLDEPMTWGPLKKAYGNYLVLTNLPGQNRIPYLPKEQLWALRDARLQRMVRYAAETVPYYRELFQQLKIDPRDVKSAVDLDRLPLVEKSAVRENPHLFLSTSRWGKNSTSFETRGSTGFPAKVNHDTRSLIVNIAFGERERDVITKLCGKKLGYREVYLGFAGWNIDKVWAFYRDHTFVPFRPVRVVLSVAEPLESILKRINDFQPDVMLGIGSYFELFFRTVASRAMRLHSPRVLIYSGDSMTPEGKRFIEDEFGVPVLSQYNAIECFKIGFSCEQRKDLHVHEDICHLRIVDSNGQNLPPGQPGEIVISNLVNRGTVLLNYRLGDLASLSREVCPCGRTLMSISDLEGRFWDIVYLPNGNWVHPRVIWEVFKGRDDILRYQFIQLEPARFELKILAKDISTYEHHIPDLLTTLRNIVGSSAEIEPRFSEELAVSSGKFRSVISRCKPPGVSDPLSSS
jgi:phenylacetate-CoA ligase